MISLLMPSRGRPELLKRSIESLGEGDYEVLVWLDTDDEADYQPVLDSLMHKNLKVFRRKRVGYKGFHKMINFLAEKSTGDWLMLWNDDAVMQSNNWLGLIHEADKPKIGVLNFSPNPLTNLFPAISREMYEIMGHYSLSAHCDSWVQDIANILKIHEHVGGVHIDHIRDQLNDETHQESQAAYEYTSPLHSSPELEALIKIDIDKIREKL